MSEKTTKTTPEAHRQRALMLHEQIRSSYLARQEKLGLNPGGTLRLEDSKGNGLVSNYTSSTDTLKTTVVFSEATAMNMRYVAKSLFPDITQNFYSFIAESGASPNDRIFGFRLVCSPSEARIEFLDSTEKVLYTLDSLQRLKSESTDTVVEMLAKFIDYQEPLTA